MDGDQTVVQPVLSIISPNIDFHCCKHCWMETRQLQQKLAFESNAESSGVKIQSDRADNGRFTKFFIDAVTQAQ